MNLTNTAGGAVSANYPSLAISNDNKIHVVWDFSPDASATTKITYKNCSSNCSAYANWSSDFNIVDNNGVRPTIASDSDSNVYVVWMDDNAGTTQNRDNINTRKRQSSGTWDANVIKTTDSQDNTYPNAAKTLLAGAPYPYLQYVYTRGTAADYNIVFGHEQMLPRKPANSDVNAIKIDGNPDNTALPVFKYSADGNLTIDFNVFDPDFNGIFWSSGRLDANIDARDVNGTPFRIITDLNLVASASAGSNRGLYCDDLNFAGGKDINRYGVTCHWDWNIMLITDRNVFIDLNVIDNNSYVDANSSDQNFGVVPALTANNAADVNIVRPNGGESIGVRDGNYRIDFNVSDKDCNGIFYCNGRLDANIDYNVSGGWTRVVTDLNLLATASAGSNKGIYCDDLNFAGSKDANREVTCPYDWNLAFS